MSKSLYLFFLFILFNLHYSAFAQTSNNHASYTATNKAIIYPKWQLKMDFREMLSYLKTHPALYEFSSKTEFDSLSKTQFNKIIDSMTIQEFYTICSPIVAKVGCSHTYLRDRRIDSLPTASFFPMKVYFEENRMYVVNSFIPGSELLPGSEIIEINKIPVSKIYSTIYNNLSADGYNKAGRQKFLTKYFGFFYAHFYGSPDQYSLLYKSYKNEAIKAYSFNTDSLLLLEKPVIDSLKCRDANLCFTILEEKNTAIISIKSFVYYDKVEYFRSFIDSCFKTIRKNHITNLIIDHRDGGGGDPFCSSYLLSYIIDKPVTYYTKEAEYYEQLTIPIFPAKHSFKGKIFILIDNGGFSTSGHLNALMKYHKVGVFIGQETGATYTCNAAVKNFTLKYTKLSLDVAQRTYTVDVEPFPKNRGIIPDYKVTPNLDDIIKGRDIVMDFTFQLIQKMK